MMNVKVFDTTLRDGSQTMGVNFSLEDKVKIAKLLDEFGVHYIEGGWPGSNPKDVAFFERMGGENLKHARLTAFSSTRVKGRTVEEDANIQTLCRSGVPVATIFGKSWDLHVTDALRATLQENLDMIHSTVEYLKHHFDEVVFDAEHFFDGYKNNPEYALQCLAAAQDAGADWLVLCDTNGGTLVEECRSVVSLVKQTVTKPVGIHTHNDGDLAVANSLAAVDAGATMVQGTINGIGERCGNANLCSVIANLSLKLGIETVPPENLRRLKYVAHYVAEMANRTHPEQMPFVGDHAFAHKGGIHVSAIRRNTKTYEHIDPALVGNTRVVSVSEQSGKSNVIEKAEELGIDLGDDNDEAARKILARVKELENKGYHYEGADASFELLSSQLMGKLKEYFTLHGFRVFVWKQADGDVLSEATVKAAVPEEVSLRGGHDDPVEHTSADAHGPVEALDKALRKVLEKFYPNLKSVKLEDYKVRILQEEQGTNATTRVLITSADEKRRWGTVGVSENIIDASWQALVDSYVYKLKKDEEDAAAGH